MADKPEQAMFVKARHLGNRCEFHRFNRLPLGSLGVSAALHIPLMVHYPWMYGGDTRFFARAAKASSIWKC